MKNTFLILFTAFLLISLISCGRIKSAGWYKNYGVEKNNLYDSSSIPKIIQALGDNSAHVRIKAIYTLSQIGLNDETISKIIQALGDNSAHVRIKAIYALSQIGLNDETISKIKFMAKSDPNPAVQRVAQTELYLYQIYSKKYIKTNSEIIKKIASRDAHDRIDAIERINRSGYNNETVQIVKYVSEHDPNEQVRKIANNGWYVSQITKQKQKETETFTEIFTIKKETIHKEPGVYQSPPIYTTKYGNYYALVIGNKDYLTLQNLKTAGNDAKTMAQLLEKNYGFKVKLLLNARRSDIVLALSELRRSLTENDNLLIYYAGHGWLDKAADEGYWLPVDASNDNILQYISNSSVTSMIKAMRAKHILIVADSCYSGKLARGIHINFYRNANYLSGIANKTSRTVLCSGGLEPVLDSGGKDGHSVFASALIDELRGNKHIIDCTELFSRLRKKVILNADQTPEYSDIRKAGHDGGDFIFVRNIGQKISE